MREEEGGGNTLRIHCMSCLQIITVCPKSLGTRAHWGAPSFLHPETRFPPIQQGGQMEARWVGDLCSVVELQEAGPVPLMSRGPTWRLGRAQLIKQLCKEVK